MKSTRLPTTDCFKQPVVFLCQKLECAMENKAEYRVQTADVYLRSGTLKSIEKGWEVPSMAEVLMVVKRSGLGRAQCAERIGVSRYLLNRWTTGEEPIHFAGWVVLCQISDIGFKGRWWE